MKQFFATAVLLLVAVSFAAQPRFPAIQTSNQVERSDHDQKPYEGRPVASIDFRGNQHFSSETIRNFMKIKKGDVYRATKLDDDVDRVRVLLLGRRGYLKARCNTPEIEDTINGLKIVLPIEEGILYRVGEVKVEEATVFSSEDILRTVGLKTGEIVDGYGISERLEELTRLYRNRGYVQFNAATIPVFNEYNPSAEEGIVDITFDLEEGEAFYISAIRFEGNTGAGEQVLRRRLLIHEGDLYNEALLRKSLLRLNALGLFQKLTQADVLFKTNDNQLSLTIQLNEKPVN
jgi:outer membrane protein insertion porin family